MIDREKEKEIREILRPLVSDRMRYISWKTRFGNALGLKRGGKDQKAANRHQHTEVYRNQINAFTGEVEARFHEVEKAIVQAVRQHPLWTEYLAGYRGVSEISAAVLIAFFDIEKAVNASKMCAYAGLAPGRDRREKGKAGFNQVLKSYLIGGLGFSLEKSSMTISRQRYLEYKNRLAHSEREVEEFVKGGNGKKRIVKWKDAYPIHRRMAAVRYMVKCFLQYDLYPTWRALMGLPVRVPYAEEYLGRKHHVDPEYLEDLEKVIGNVPGEEDEIDEGELMEA